MKCRIKAETGRRMRIHAEVSRMSLQEADILEYYLRSVAGVRLSSKNVLQNSRDA